VDIAPARRRQRRGGLDRARRPGDLSRVLRGARRVGHGAALCAARARPSRPSRPARDQPRRGHRLMSPATATPTLWRRQESREAARERLHDTVAALARARHLQLIVDHAFAGLLTGLCLATLAVLALRLGALPLPLGMTALVTVAVALAGSLAIAAWRRPDPLQVAIRADVALRLKQRLSTAWELVCVEGDTELSDRLAAHAVK